MNVGNAKCAGCGRGMEISRMHCPKCDVAMEGSFAVSPLGRLGQDEQVFVHAFLKSHGSIKQMERLLGVSYPTVKNRLNAIVNSLEAQTPSTNSRVLEQLAQGEITVDEALERLG